MKLNRLPLLLFRTPQFPIDKNLEEAWEDLKTSIEYSSPDFSETIKNIKGTELDLLDDKTFYSIWKYFNRARWRPIPYGSFANFGTLNISQTRNGQPIVIDSKQKLHAFVNWPEKRNIKWNPQQLFETGTMLCANTSWYTTSAGIRFLAKTGQLFEIAEIQKDDFLIDLLEKCRTAISSKVLKQFVLDEYDLSSDDFTALINDMIDLQLLQTNLSPNLIGEEYFKRVGYHQEQNKTDYLIAERTVIQSEFPQEYLNNLESCINYLLGSTLKMENSGLEKFKTEFVDRFDQKIIPLMVALDPELGCGYEELAQTADQDDLIEDIKNNALVSGIVHSTTQWTNFQKYLLQEIVQASAERRDRIFLSDFPVDKKNKTTSVANTFSAMFSEADGNIILNHLGGSTANALTGRFNLASEEVETLGKTLSSIESAANPNVIFFDIAYLSEEKVDNINRRKSIYDYELSIESWSCSENPIRMNDIMVTVRGDEIILYSKHYGKRLIPRLSTAYNYTRSDLSLFRFLCDLQHQQLETRLLFDVQQLLPGLSFYPRIQYKNIILSLAKWKVPNASIPKGKTASESITLLRQYLNDHKIPRFFTAGNGDQHLCFDQLSISDLQAFSNYSNKMPDFYVSEMIIPKNALLNDEFGHPYINQFILNLYHTEQIYPPFHISTINESLPKLPADIPPGKDWLYLEIYCHSKRVGDILSGPVQQLLDQYQDDLTCWFFIRYTHPKHHIRLRLRLKPEANQHVMLYDFSKLIEAEFIDGIISDLQIKTYNREIERYGADLIEEVEAHFSKDSRYVLQLIKKPIPVIEHYKRTVKLIRGIYNSLNSDLKMQLDWADHVQESFVKEHRLDSAYFKKLNKHYNVYKSTYFIEDNSKDYLTLQSSFNDLIEICSKHRRFSLMTSLIHMHINRLFDSDQRTHELVIYYFLYKELQSSKYVRASE